MVEKSRDKEERRLKDRVGEGLHRERRRQRERCWVREFEGFGGS